MSNAGPLIHLSWVDQLELLPALFESVFVPPAVRDEVLMGPADVIGISSLRDMFVSSQFTVRSVRQKSQVETLRRTLDIGEAETIVLATENEVDLVLLDDLQAREEAYKRGLRVSGTVGVLRLARQRGLINAATPLLLEMRRQGFWLSNALLDRIEREEL